MNVENKIIIAIDGFSSSGKSTMAKQLAKALGYRYIDSGAMYRAVTLYALRKNIEDNADAIIESLPHINIDFRVNDDGTQTTILNGEDVEKDIRTMKVSSLVSDIAVIPQVRKALVKMQQKLGLQKGIVMDGRDIGTTVFPDAELKIYVNASAEKRAARRLAELRAKGDTTTSLNQVLENIRHRDWLDTHRDESPMHPAEDAFLLDNSDMTFEQQNQYLLDLAERVIKVKNAK